MAAAVVQPLTLRVPPCRTVLQGWNVPFWRCQGAVCAENVNDVKFIETVIQDMQRRFAVKKGQVRRTH